MDSRQTIIDLVEIGLVKPSSLNGNERHSDPTPIIPDAPAPERIERLTDLGNAYRFVRMHGEKFRFTTGRGWLAWDGRRWQRDNVGAVQRAAKETVLALYTEAAEASVSEAKYRELAAKPGLSDEQRANMTELADKQAKVAREVATWAKTCQSRARIEALVALAASELPIATTDDTFDNAIWLLNCQNGTLDLRTSTLRPHDPRDYLTTLTTTEYDSAAACPTWEQFLHRIMDGNQELLDFLRRMVGYSLTGDVSEQVLFFLHGSGANGKSTFILALFGVLGADYAVQAAPDLLIARQGERHPTEVADLKGKRIVASIEVEDGRRMAEGLVKQLTGGDVLKARYMREDFFSFRPTHKLFLVANHKPAIRGTDYAIWRRIRRIPFNVTIPDHEKDPHLLDRLQAEATGILAWCVRGCLEWQRTGLAAPHVVMAATEEYRQEQDTIGVFLRECTVTVSNARTKASVLYAAYQKWADTGGLHAVNITTFGLSLAERGFAKEQNYQGVFYTGIGLLSVEN